MTLSSISLRSGSGMIAITLNRPSKGTSIQCSFSCALAILWPNLVSILMQSPVMRWVFFAMSTTSWRNISSIVSDLMVKTRDPLMKFAQ